MEKQKVELPAPFATSVQHVRSVQQARNDQGLQPEDSEQEASPADSTQKVTQERAETKQSGWNYTSIRNEFINQSKKRGCSYLVAKCQWDLSKEKRAFLGKVSVPELKKRRFLGKDATHNPWA